ncbi:hypothetical protein BHM03_00016764 [Ensete ventricosum]|nr:hypothetical protein BHM03_00016764 [Ensete ventricosum]
MTTAESEANHAKRNLFPHLRAPHTAAWLVECEADGQMASGRDLLRRPCADEEDPAIRHRAIPDDAAPPTSGEKTRPARSKRVASLDIFRGLTVAVPSRPMHQSPLCCFGFLLWSSDAGGCWAVDDPGGRSRRRMAGDRARALEWLQPRRFRDALLPLHRWDGHPSFPQGCSHPVPLFLCSPLLLGLLQSHICCRWCLQRIPSRGRALRRVMVRALKLLFWGIILQG